MENSNTTRYDTVVVGGGQSGLAAGHYLKRTGRPFLILDAEMRTGETWRRRWGSLRLFSPAQYDGLPGLPFPAPEGTFPTKDEAADYLEAYARRFELPILHGTRVTRLTGSSSGMIIECEGRRFESRNVIVAAGAYSRPNIPRFAQELNSGIRQLHSSEYRQPSDVPGVVVLVVGFGTSGVEIATELALAGKKVVLSGRPTAQVFSRFVPALFASQHPVGKLLGRAYWRMMEDVITVDTALGRKVRSQTARQGQPLFRLNEGHAIAADVEIAPRAVGVQNGKARLDDGRVLETAAIVWCTGFLPNYPFLDFPALSFDEKGWPVTDHGSVPQIPGLYFLGLPFQVGLTSTLLGGAGRDAELVVRRIAHPDNAGRQSGLHHLPESSKVRHGGGDPNDPAVNPIPVRARSFHMKDDTEAIRSTRAAAAVVYAHAGVVLVHGAAHARLHVALSTWAGIFVAVVIGITPILALVLLKHGNRRKGAGMLGAAMAAAFLFGLWNHFVVHGDDHVAHTAGGPWTLPFQITAGLLVATEGIGSILALQLLRSQAKADAETERAGSPGNRRADYSARTADFGGGSV